MTIGQTPDAVAAAERRERMRVVAEQARRHAEEAERQRAAAAAEAKATKGSPEVSPAKTREAKGAGAAAPVKESDYEVTAARGRRLNATRAARTEEPGPMTPLEIAAYSVAVKGLVQQRGLGAVDAHRAVGADPRLAGWIVDAAAGLADGEAIEELGQKFKAGFGAGAVQQLLKGAAGAEAPDRVERVDLPEVEAKGQLNHGRNVRWEPKHAFRPGKDIDELSRTLRWIDENLDPSVKVKAGGSRHSWSPIAATDGVYIHPEKMKFIRTAKGPLVRKDYDPARAENTLRIGAGTTIREINAELWKRDKALPVLGGYDGQTLGGVLPTGTHGSVLSHGPLAEMVRSVDLVRPDGTKMRIEPADGMTDAAAFRKRFPDWELVQRDDTFGAALLHQGSLGVVHSYAVEARGKFWLDEKRSLTTGKDASEVLQGENIYRLMETDRSGATAPRRRFAGHDAPAYHLELLWNPHTDKMVVTSRQPVSGAKEAEFQDKEPAAFANPPGRDLVRTILTSPDHQRPGLGTWITENFKDQVSKLNDLAGKLVPALAPKLVDMALDSMKDGTYVQRSYNVFNIGDGANHLAAQSGTISVPLEGDQYLRAMKIMEGTAARFAKEHGEYQTGPISMRFVKGSKALLGDPVDVCKFEIIFSGDGEREQALARKMLDAYHRDLQAELGSDVRLHWGQIVPESYLEGGNAAVRKQYPGAARFEEIRREFDPKDRYLNPWQARFLQ